MYHPETACFHSCLGLLEDMNVNISPKPKGF